MREITGYGTVIMRTVGQMPKKGPVYATRESLTLLTLRDEQYMLELLTGCLEVYINEGGKMLYYFTPTFISTLENDFKNSIVYFESEVSSELATSFLGKRVHTFFGFSGQPDISWSERYRRTIVHLDGKGGQGHRRRPMLPIPELSEGSSYFFKYSNSTGGISYGLWIK